MTQIEKAVRMLTELDVNPRIEEVLVSEVYGRVLAEDVTAEISVPSFRKSAYDGYALRSADIQAASPQAPVILKVSETIPAGRLGRRPVTEGTAARIMTGAAMPKGADAVVKHEDVRCTGEEIICFQPAVSANIVEIGEDVRQGACLAGRGTVAGAAQAAVLAGQGRQTVLAYERPQAAVVSTGSELLVPGQELTDGKIYNTNPYLISGYLQKYGVVPKDFGIVPDDIEKLAQRIQAALENSDLAVTTGGVSVGDFDFIPQALQRLGAEILFHRLPFKPGGAMLAAQKEGKVILGLSGNPGAAAAGLLRIGLPYIKKLCGRLDYASAQAKAALDRPFPKQSRQTRILRGKARIKDGRLVFCLNENQRNGAVSSMLDCDLLGEVPEGSGSLPAGAEIQVFFI